MSLRHPNRKYLIRHETRDMLRLTAAGTLGQAVAARTQALMSGGRVEAFYADDCPELDQLFSWHEAGRTHPYRDPQREKAHE